MNDRELPPVVQECEVDFDGLFWGVVAGGFVINTERKMTYNLQPTKGPSLKLF